MNTPKENDLFTASLLKSCGLDCINISAARALALEQRKIIQETMEKKNLIPADASLIVFGSLARDEVTQGSDVDWSLLVDGQANGDHHDASMAIKSTLENDLELAKPGPTGTFGSLVFSHELVHQIGGDDDTNRNTTRRVLLLLESCPIESNNSKPVYERVTKQIVNRYLEQEPGIVTPDGERRVPRFLLNDVVRYWRTMAVDYARKVRDRNAEGWALRNIKLRLSRKLTFASGMLACLDYKLNPHEHEPEQSLFGAPNMLAISAQEHIRRCVAMTPLDILSRSIELHCRNNTEKKHELAKLILSSYDSFLGVLNDRAKRTTLKMLKPGDQYNSPVFQECRDLGIAFQSGLSSLFFNTNKELTEATQEYGVF